MRVVDVRNDLDQLCMTVEFIICKKQCLDVNPSPRLNPPPHLPPLLRSHAFPTDWVRPAK